MKRVVLFIAGICACLLAGYFTSRADESLPPTAVFEYSNSQPDWLLDPAPYRAQVKPSADGREVELSNGLVRRVVARRSGVTFTIAARTFVDLHPSCGDTTS